MDFKTFNDVKDRRLQGFNRAVLWGNIANDFGIEAALTYISQFDEKEQTMVVLYTRMIVKEGVDEVKRKVIRDIEPEGWADDEE